MKGWTGKGDQIIVILDENVDLTTNEDGFKERLEEIGSKELIISKHLHLTPPSTRTPGTKTIDGIFGTPALDVEWTGYSPFCGFTDHRLSWVDIRWESAFGLFQKIQGPLARHLQCDNPKAVDIYIRILAKILSAASVAPKVSSLDISVQTPRHHKTWTNMKL